MNFIPLDLQGAYPRNDIHTSVFAVYNCKPKVFWALWWNNSKTCTCTNHHVAANQNGIGNCMTQLREASQTVTNMRTVAFWPSVMAARMKSQEMDASITICQYVHDIVHSGFEVFSQLW